MIQRRLDGAKDTLIIQFTPLKKRTLNEAYTENLCKQLLENPAEFDAMGIPPVKKLADKLSLIREALQALKKLVDGNPFEDPQEALLPPILVSYTSIIILNASDLDHVLFIRDAQPSGPLLPEMPAQTPGFATAADYLFAKFIAYEKLQDYLIDSLYGNTEKPTAFRSKKGRTLKWTGD